MLRNSVAKMESTRPKLKRPNLQAIKKIVQSKNDNMLADWKAQISSKFIVVPKMTVVTVTKENNPPEPAFKQSERASHEDAFSKNTLNNSISSTCASIAENRKAAKPLPLLKMKTRAMCKKSQDTDKTVEKSDEEFLVSLSSSFEPTIEKNACFEAQSDNREASTSNSSQCTVRICVQNIRALRYDMNSNETFCRVFGKTARDLNIPVDDLCFFHKADFVMLNDTPESLGLENYFIIEARTTAGDIVRPDNPNEVELAFQTSALRSNRFVLFVSKDEAFDSIKLKLVEAMRKKQGSSKEDFCGLVLKFDGETISDTDTPALLDLESGDCIDVTTMT